MITPCGHGNPCPCVHEQREKDAKIADHLLWKTEWTANSDHSLWDIACREIAKAIRSGYANPPHA